MSKEERNVPARLTAALDKIDSAKMLSNLQSLFDTIMSGQDYNKEQVKSATQTSNAAVKLMRFEFDVYKYFTGRISG